MGFGPVLSAAGSVLGAVGSIAGGQAGAGAAGANAQMMEYQAQIARNNAIIANQMAEHEAQVGMEQAGRKSMEGAAQGGAIKAGFAASGIDPNTGSAARVGVSQRELNKLDVETVLSNAQQKVYGYRAQAANFGAQAGLDTMQENRLWGEVPSDITGGWLRGASSLLSGASSLPFGGGGGFTQGNYTGFAAGTGTAP